MFKKCTCGREFTKGCALEPKPQPEPGGPVAVDLDQRDPRDEPADLEDMYGCDPWDDDHHGKHCASK